MKMVFLYILGAVTLMVLAYRFSRIVYNLTFHPLARFSGPGSWSSSRLPFVNSLLKGRIVHRVEQLHRKYGPIVRIAPNELSFAHPEAWSNIFQPSRGQQFRKDPVWWYRAPSQPESLLNATPESHTRMQKVLGHSFTERALAAQEPIVQKYVGLLIDRLREKVLTPEKAGQKSETIVDMVPWLNFTTFDVFGDLAFAESFDCLQHSKYHPWIALLFNSVKATSFIIVTRFYPLLQIFLMAWIPKSLIQMQKDHRIRVANQIQRRLNWEVERPDFMSNIMRHNDERGLSVQEIQATFVGLTTAGSETTATALSGIVNYLSANPEKLAKLVEEVRSTFSSDEQMAFSTLVKLPYLNAVINEGLRLCPPVPTILPRLVPKGGAAICGAWIPEGTSVSLQSWALFRDPERFHEPLSFHPERWLPQSRKEPSPFVNDQLQGVQPFSVGPRQCLGKHLAKAEMRLILAKLVWAFDIGQAGNPQEWSELRTFLLVEKKPIVVSLRLAKAP